MAFLNDGQYKVSLRNRLIDCFLFADDHRVSEAEFSGRATHHIFREVVFMELDYDGDGYLDRSAELGQFIVMDKNCEFPIGFDVL